MSKTKRRPRRSATTSNKRQFIFWLYPKTHALLKKIAEGRNQSASAYVEELLSEALYAAKRGERRMVAQ